MGKNFEGKAELRLEAEGTLPIMFVGPAGDALDLSYGEKLGMPAYCSGAHENLRGLRRHQRRRQNGLRRPTECNQPMAAQQNNPGRTRDPLDITDDRRANPLREFQSGIEIRHEHALDSTAYDLVRKRAAPSKGATKLGAQHLVDCRGMSVPDKIHARQREEVSVKNGFDGRLLGGGIDSGRE